MSTRVADTKWRSGWLGLVAVLLLSVSCVEQLEEGPPPGYIGGDIPRQYRGLANPHGLEDRQALAAGRSIYLTRCARCHGDDGRGNGPQAPYLEPAPANFSTPPMLNAFRSHQDYVFWWVSDGVAETGMPAFKDELSETERWQAITYAWYLGEQAAGSASGWIGGEPVSTRRLPLASIDTP
ncbi:MAG: c-type cytochrome [Chloroflexota bacterium]